MRYFETVATFICKCQGCEYEIKFARVEGGLIGYEKIDKATGEVIKHSNHEIFPNLQPITTGSRAKKNPNEVKQLRRSKLASTCSLSGAQKIYIMKHYRPGQPELFVSQMIKDSTIVCSHEQKENPKLFKKRVTKFANDPHNQKYMNDISLINVIISPGEISLFFP